MKKYLPYILLGIGGLVAYFLWKNKTPDKTVVNVADSTGTAKPFQVANDLLSLIRGTGGPNPVRADNTAGLITASGQLLGSVTGAVKNIYDLWPKSTALKTPAVAYKPVDDFYSAYDYSAFA